MIMSLFEHIQVTGLDDFLPVTSVILDKNITIKGPHVSNALIPF